MKAFDGAGRSAAVGRREDQCGGVQLSIVLVVLCTGRDLDPTAKTPRGQSASAWQMIFQAYSLEKRCKVGSADDGGTGVCVGHERCGRSWRRDECQHDREWVTTKAHSKESWKANVA